MQGFHIWSIAKYEIKTLTRSWFFRIFGILALVVLFFFNLVVQTDVGGSGDWDLTILPAGIPYRNLLILNMAQAIIAAFLASDFLRRDKKLDSTEVIYMRSMSNVDYVLGKTLGNLIVFIGLNLVVLLMVAIFNLISKTTGIDAMAYLQYLLYLSIPTLVFIMGLSFLLMSVIRNQGITFILLLGYIALTVFYLKGKVFYLFDYMAYNVPMMKSDMAGFGNIQEVLIHRGLYFFLGLGFIFWTIVLLKRLPQSKPASSLSLILAILFVGVGVFLGYRHTSTYHSDQKLRSLMIELNNEMAGQPMASVTRHHIRFEHSGHTFRAESKMNLVNMGGQNMDRIILKLNPGLVVEEITTTDGSLEFERERHIITIREPLLQGDSLECTISYRGHIDESACYLDMDEELRLELSEYYQNRQAFVQPGYVLLTPETQWYPTSGVGYSNANPRWIHADFTRFSLEVKAPSHLTAISQGVREETPDGARFQMDHPMPSLTLILGSYDHLGMEADSIEYHLMVHPRHDYFMELFPDLKDTIPAIIEARMQDFERQVRQAERLPR